jgi:hypothetical protein
VVVAGEGRVAVVREGAGVAVTAAPLAPHLLLQQGPQPPQGVGEVGVVVVEGVAAEVLLLQAQAVVQAP